ncbi:MAG TPA: terminase family protein [Arachidicoccus soli]|nr:terminase family protein [Arachidicoccus soli]
MWKTKAQFVAVAAGRGSGKTEIARRRVVRFLPVKKPWPDPVYVYALPTINQAKRLAWDKIIQLIPTDWIKKVNQSDMSIRTIFGSTLYVLGMDNPQRAEGLQYDGVILDESCDQKPKVFDLSILPALSHRNGWCWRIGVPKRHGIGSRDFKRFYDLGSSNIGFVSNNFCDLSDNEREETVTDSDLYTDESESERIIVESYSWPSSDIIDSDKLTWAKSNLDARDYNEQYNASWESANGAIFYGFIDKLLPEGNLDSSIRYNPQYPLIIGQDFNVDPMAWIIGQHIPANDNNNGNNGSKIDRFNVIDEIYIRNTNTVASLVELHKIITTKYSPNAVVHFYGDATARARKTAASYSDYVHIQQFISEGKFKGGRIFFLKKNPRTTDRFAACNAMFCNAKNERRLFIHPQCKHLRQDLQERQYKEGTNEADDYGDIGHISDALGYPIHRLFPVAAKIRETGNQKIITKVPGKPINYNVKPGTMPIFGLG